MDTNVLVYAVNADDPHHEPCRTAVDAWLADSRPWAVTWSVLYELARVVTHPAVLPRPLSDADAWRVVQTLLDAPGLRVLTETRRHREVMAQVLRESPGITGNLVHDLHIAVVLREHGVTEIWTRDQGFRRFGFLTVREPAAASP